MGLACGLPATDYVHISRVGLALLPRKDPSACCYQVAAMLRPLQQHARALGFEMLSGVCSSACSTVSVCIQVDADRNLPHAVARVFCQRMKMHEKRYPAGPSYR